MRRFGALLAAGLVISMTATLAQASGVAEPTFNFELIGSNPLDGRGMNAAPAMYGHHVYIGSRTDGTHPDSGVKIVDVADPAHPTVVGSIGLPEEAVPSSTSRELRVWPQQKLLLVLNFQCSSILHACVSPADGAGSAITDITFYDLTDPASPRVAMKYTPSRTPHEMYLWVDPVRANRALLYFSTPSSSTTRPNLIVADISRARQGSVTEVVQWLGDDLFSEADRSNNDVRLHSLGVSIDGTRAYLAYLGGGFLMIDTSDLAAAKPEPTIRLATPIANKLSWGNPGAHSAVKVPGRDLVLTTDEVYGDLLDQVTGYNHGCPWGWMRMIDISDEAKPKLVGEYKIAQNEQTYCASDDGQDELNTYFTSFSAHNPTVLRTLALVTWHSGGLQAIDIGNPAHPNQAGVFSPLPLERVTTEDPALSMGHSKVVVWSYPIIRDGLIYIVDVRNGLYVVRYTGPGAEEIAEISFLEGNSNLGDAAALERSAVLGRRVVKPVKESLPRANRGLPSTGADDTRLLALAVLAGAVVLMARMRKHDHR